MPTDEKIIHGRTLPATPVVEPPDSDYPPGSNRAGAPAVMAAPCVWCGQPQGQRCVVLPPAGQRATDPPRVAGRVHQSREALYQRVLYWNQREVQARGRTCGTCALYADHEPGQREACLWEGRPTEANTTGYCNAKITRLIFRDEVAGIMRETVADVTPACPLWVPQSLGA